MGKTQKTFTILLWGLLVVAMLAVVATRATRSTDGRHAVGERAAPDEPAPAKFDVLFAAPQFNLTDQSGTSVSSESLRGKVWIADFIFTNCAGPCPVMTSKMAAIQVQLKHPDVRLVSFTVDPARDTPEVLKTYADRYQADHSRWHFLTGTPEQIKAVAQGMKIAAQKEADESVTHSTHFILVDRNGQACGIYRNSDEDISTLLAKDATELAEKTAPAKENLK